MFYYNALNLEQIGGGNQIKQGDFGSRFSYKLENEKNQELDNFDKKVAHINLVLDDKIVFTTTTTVDKSTVTFNIDKAIPVGLYFLEIKIDDYIFPSDRRTIIFVQSGSVAYDLKDLIPNYDTNMTLSSILSDLSKKGIDISDLQKQINTNKTNITNTGSRIDNLIANAGNGTVPSELTDMRVTYDGNTYVTAGSAVRAGFKQISDKLQDIDSTTIERSTNIFDKKTAILGKMPSSTIGSSIDTLVDVATGVTASKIYNVKKGDVVYMSTGYTMLFFYDSQKKLIGVFSDDNQVKQKTVSEGSVYMRWAVAQNIPKYYDNFMLSINKPLPTVYEEYYVRAKKQDEDKISRILIAFDACSDILRDPRYDLVKKGYGYNFTFSISGGITEAQLKDAIKDGLDFGTYSGENWPVDTLGGSSVNSDSQEAIDKWESYVSNALKKSESVKAYNPVAWFSRQGISGRNLERACRKHGYKMIRGFNWGEQYTNRYFDGTKYVIPTQEVTDDTYQTAIQNIEEAVTLKQDICLLSHSLIDNPNGLYADVTSSSWTAVLNKIKELVDSGKAKVVTFREYYNELSPNDGYENDYQRLLKMSI